jgi:hypothetical protein
MSLVVPNAAEIDALQKFLNRNLTVKLFSNNYIPIDTSSAASFTEVTGGGYASKSIVYADWTFTGGTPSYGQSPKLAWTFTGATGGPGVVYGYYVIENSGGTLMWAERFPPSVVPFTPKNGSIIQVTPKFTGSSVY